MLNKYEEENEYQDSEEEYDRYVDVPNGALGSYLKDIKSYKTLSSDEANRLIALAQNGDTSAKNTVINSFLKFVVCIAKKYFSLGADPMDLISEGNLGLAKAIDGFDTSKNFKFTTYAYQVISGNILVFLNKHYNLCSTTPKFYNLARNVKEFITQYIQENGIRPSDEIIMKSCKINEKQLRRIEMFSNQVYSMDKNINDTDGLTISDVIASESDEFFENVHKKVDNEFKRASLKKHISSLTQSERIVLIFSYGLFGKEVKTTEQIANYLKVTKRCVEQTKYRAQTKLYLSLQSDIDLFF